jgi:dihydroorotate dehydrogenase
MIPEWYLEHPPIYDIGKTYLENLEQGPFFNAAIPARPKTGQSIDFLGHKVRSSIGVPAGPLLGSRWIALAAKLGFDIVTYKTIRSSAHPGHGLPNMIYIEPTGPHTAHPIPEPPLRLEDLTVTNSFGMPSRSPDFLIADIDAARRSLGAGQLMIVSIVGTPHPGIRFLDDFVQTALFAKEAGAQVIEANFSCPNVEKAEGILYMDPATVREFAGAIAKAIHPLPLILKVGEIRENERMKEILHAAARGGARAICGLNSVSMKVVDKSGKSALGPQREQSGVCGGHIRSRALHFLRTASKIISGDKLDLALMGCGGIMRPAHFDEFLNAGATVAMSATGMMWDPFLAMRYHCR